MKTSDWRIFYTVPPNPRSYTCTYAFTIEHTAEQVLTEVAKLLGPGKKVIFVERRQLGPGPDECGLKGPAGVTGALGPDDCGFKGPPGGPSNG
jgi:hypothetical protein